MVGGAREDPEGSSERDLGGHVYQENDTSFLGPDFGWVRLKTGVSSRRFRRDVMPMIEFST